MNPDRPGAAPLGVRAIMVAVVKCICGRQTYVRQEQEGPMGELTKNERRTVEWIERINIKRRKTIPDRPGAAPLGERAIMVAFGKCIYGR